MLFSFFTLNDTASTKIYTLSLHDALPISFCASSTIAFWCIFSLSVISSPTFTRYDRSEEHTSELQSQFHLVCRLLLEKKKKTINIIRLKADYPNMNTYQELNYYIHEYHVI